MKSELNLKPMNDLDVIANSNALDGVKIALCVGGGIAAVETPRIIRALRRKGANVKVFATQNALKFVGREALEWASAQPIIGEISGLAEHITKEDLVLVVPATADLLGKAAHGICPEPCSTYIQSALGMEKPIMFLPTMHDSMRSSPAVIRNLEILAQFRGVEFLEARVEEGKWKAPLPEGLALEVAFRFNKRRHFGSTEKTKRALVTLGGTLAKLDAARAISNFSTGTLGSYLIEALLEKGIEVVALCAAHSAPIRPCAGLTKIDAPLFEDFQEWLKNRTNTLNLDALFHLAAISDYGPVAVNKNKISSNNEKLALELHRLPKLIAMPHLEEIPLRVACKYTSTNSKTDEEKAIKLMKTYSLNAVYWNWGDSAFGLNKSGGGLLFQRDSTAVREIHSKHEAAKNIASLFECCEQHSAPRSSQGI